MRNVEEKYRRPELFLQELLRKYAKGQILDTTSNVQPFMRAIVLAVDPDGGNLSNSDAAGSVTVGDKTYSATVGPTNPPNAIKARVISRGFDRFVTDAEARIFWPMSQNDHISLPLKPGEHVMVMFEDVSFEHGFWLAKVPGNTDANFFDGNSVLDAEEQTKKASDAFFPVERQAPSDAGVTDSASRQRLDGLFV